MDVTIESYKVGSYTVRVGAEPKAISVETTDKGVAKLLDEIRLAKGNEIKSIVAIESDAEQNIDYFLWFTSIEEVSLTDDGVMIGLKNKDDSEATVFKLGEKLTELRFGMKNND